MADIDAQEMTDGRYITEADENSHAMVAMIGSELANKLFPSLDPVGHEVMLDNRPFIVVGVAKPIGTVLGPVAGQLCVHSSRDVHQDLWRL